MDSNIGLAPHRGGAIAHQIPATEKSNLINGHFLSHFS